MKKEDYEVPVIYLSHMRFRNGNLEVTQRRRRRRQYNKLTTLSLES